MAENKIGGALPPIHPGEYLKEVILPALDTTTTAFADHVGLGRQTLYDLMAGRIGVTAATALRLGKATGMRPQMWLNLQALHDLKVAEAAIGDQVAKITRLPEIAAAAGTASGKATVKARGAGVIQGGLGAAPKVLQAGYAMGAKMAGSKTHLRQVANGQFVTEEEAKALGKGVVRETIKTPNSKR